MTYRPRCLRKQINTSVGHFFGQHPGYSAVTIPEHWFRDRLAHQVGGATEVSLPYGRVDVLTSDTAFEVKPKALWKRAVQQALAYSAQTGCVPAVALFGAACPDEVLRIYLRLRDSRPPVLLWWAGRTRWEPVASRRACRAMPEVHPWAD